jgi:DNA-binding NarL/FixJ family response regulator
MLNVLICDQRPLVRNGLRMLLSADPVIAVIGMTGSGTEALEMATHEDPDVVITGLQVTDLDTKEFLYRIGATPSGPARPVLVYAVGESDDRLADIVRSGIDGLLCEDATAVELGLAVQALAGGRPTLGARVARQLIDSFRERDTGHYRQRLACANLTDREQEVFVHVASGYSVDDVARTLFIGTATVRTHLYRLRAKLGLRDRAHLVSFAHQAGLVPSTDVRLRDDATYAPEPAPARLGARKSSMTKMTVTADAGLVADSSAA